MENQIISQADINQSELSKNDFPIKDNKTKTVFFILITIVAVACVGIGLIYANKQRNSSSPMVESDIKSKPVTGSATIAITNWKTYSHPSKTGESYELKYPATWEYEEADGLIDVDGAPVGSTSVTFKKITNSANKAKSGSYVAIYRTGKSQKAPQKAADFSSQESNYNKAKDITISGVAALQITSLRDGGRTISLRYGNYDFSIQESLMGDEKDNKETQEVFDQIISTFKFSDKATDNNLNSYSSPRLGFEFNFPEYYHFNNADHLEIMNLSDSYVGCGVPFQSLELRKKIYESPAQNPRISLFIINLKKDLNQYINDCAKDRLTNWTNYCTEFNNNGPGGDGICQKDGPKIVSQEDISNGLIKGKKVVLFEEPGAPNNQATQFIFQKDNLIYVVQANYGSMMPDSKESGVDESKDVENIFNSFKFMEKNI